jgi:hypothetical protein
MPHFQIPYFISIAFPPMPKFLSGTTLYLHKTSDFKKTLSLPPRFPNLLERWGCPSSGLIGVLSAINPINGELWGFTAFAFILSSYEFPF